jgi:hypothetical protein
MPIYGKQMPALDLKYIFISIISVLATFIFHELAHVAMGEMLGYNMGMTMNAAYPLSGKIDSDMHQNLISAAGPVFTILQAIFCYFLLLKGRSLYLYPFLFVPLYMRLLAGVMNGFNPNDEGRISANLQLGTYTLSIIVCLLIGLMVYHVTKKCGLSRKFQLMNFFLAMLFTSILIMANQYFDIKLIS